MNNLNAKKGADVTLFDKLVAINRRREEYKKKNGKAPSRQVMAEICEKLELSGKKSTTGNSHASLIRFLNDEWKNEMFKYEFYYS